MTQEPRASAAQPRLRSIANVIAAFALAILAVWSISYVSVIWNPGRYGDLGLSIGDDNSLPADNASYLVRQIVPGYPAEKAGIKIGDRVNSALSTRARLVLTRYLAPRPGEEVAIQVSRGSSLRMLTLKARPFAALPANDSVQLALLTMANAIFLAVGLALVLLRPNRMTWGFYLLADTWINFLPFSGNWPFSFLPTGLWLGYATWSDVATAAGIVGFLVFSVRFPTNAPTGWLRTIDILTPYMAATLAIVFLCSDMGTQLLILPIGPTRLLWKVWFAGIVAVTILGSVVLLMRFFRTRGPERYRIRWVVLGFMCVSIAAVAIVLSWNVGLPTGPPGWFICIFGSLAVAFPIIVAYAVLQHRVIDVRFVVSRSLVIGAIVAIVTLVVVTVDWLFTVMLPSSRFETAAFFGVAILIGLSLNALRQRIGKTIDSLFFRQWRQTQEQSETLADALRSASSSMDVFDVLTSGIARAFSLASAALLERVESGGFVRVAAFGWQAGALWHILPDDPMVLRVDKKPRTMDIDMQQWQGRGVPAGIARPILMVPIVASRYVPAILLLGAHETGTSLDPDEIRSIRALCADASRLYLASLRTEAGRTAFLASSLSAL